MGREEMPAEPQRRTVFRRARFSISPKTNRYLCPEGKLLRPQGRFNSKNKRGFMAYRYEAKISDCAPCIRKPECCPEIRATVADCYGEWKIPRFWRFGKRWPAKRHKRNTVGAARCRVLSRVDQKQAGSAAVSRARFSESADGNALGLLYLQLATLDSLKQAPSNSRSHLTRKLQDHKYLSAIIRPEKNCCWSNPAAPRGFFHSFNHKDAVPKIARTENASATRRD